MTNIPSPIKGWPSYNSDDIYFVTTSHNRPEMLPTILMVKNSGHANPDKDTITVGGQEYNLYEWGKKFFDDINIMSRVVGRKNLPKEHSEIVDFFKHVQPIAEKSCEEVKADKDKMLCLERALPVAAGIMTVDEKRCGDYATKKDDSAYSQCVVDSVKFYLNLADSILQQYGNGPPPAPKRPSGDDDRR